MILRGANSRGAITPLGHLRRAKNRAPSIFICEALHNQNYFDIVGLYDLIQPGLNVSMTETQ